ncbi:MAG: carbohydrate ABC transporter permease [Chloroflexota bacterium]|jgi:multiple sugar transport system permease protein|nr:carbohydrate ABC transporter permease [Chloroflexota bacterium]
MNRAAGIHRARRGEIAAPARLLLYVLLIVTALAVAMPFVIMLFTSFKIRSEVFTFPPLLIPQTWTTDNYVLLWSRLPFAKLVRNSLIYSFSITLASLLFDSMCAYALARLNFRGRNVMFIAILATMMVPAQVTLVPLFFNLFEIGWINTFQGLIVPRMTSAFGIFLLRQFFVSIPIDLEDAARIDGAGEFRIYWQIVLPLSGPAIATVFIFHFMYNWNDFLWPLIITMTQEMRTLPTGLALFMGDHNIEYGLLMAGATLAALPLIVAFLFAQRYFVAGIALTGTKE